MGRIILTSVGTSLLEKSSEWKQLRQNGHPSRFRWSERLDSLTLASWRQETLRSRDAQTEGYEVFKNLAGQTSNYANDFVELMQAVWASTLPNKGSTKTPGKREASPAELASLDLMEVTNEDLVVLLYSDTPEGAFCATCLKEMFGRGIAVGKKGIPQAETKKVAGLQPKDREKFEQEAVGNLAEVIAEYFYQKALPDNQGFVLNVTGGFKASIPTLTFIAGLLKEQEDLRTPVRLCCLYEEAPELLWQPLIPYAVEPEEVRNRLLEAGKGTVGDPCSRLSWDNLKPKEKALYIKSNPLELSSLGRAVQKVLLAKKRADNRRVQ